MCIEIEGFLYWGEGMWQSPTRKKFTHPSPLLQGKVLPGHCPQNSKLWKKVYIYTLKCHVEDNETILKNVIRSAKF